MGQAQINVRTRACSGTFIARTKQAALTHNVRGKRLNKIDKMDSKIGFEMSLIVVEAIRGRCASFMILTATVWEISGGQTNSSILVL